MFEIKSVSRISPDTVLVKVFISSKEWLKARNSGALGQLYGIDISNAAYRQHGVKASNPTVKDYRAIGGVKVIDLTYQDSEWVEAPDNVIRVDFVNKRRAA